MEANVIILSIRMQHSIIFCNEMKHTKIQQDIMQYNAIRWTAVEIHHQAQFSIS